MIENRTITQDNTGHTTLTKLQDVLLHNHVDTIPSFLFDKLTINIYWQLDRIGLEA